MATVPLIGQLDVQGVVLVTTTAGKDQYKGSAHYSCEAVF